MYLSTKLFLWLEIVLKYLHRNLSIFIAELN